MPAAVLLVLVVPLGLVEVPFVFPLFCDGSLTNATGDSEVNVALITPFSIESGLILSHLPSGSW